MRRVAVALLAVVSLFVTTCPVQAAVQYAITDLGTLGGSSSCAYAVNDRGQVTGYAYAAMPGDNVFLYSGSTMTKVGSGIGHDINDVGQIVGERTAQYTHAVFYDGTTMKDLGTLGGDLSWGYGINNSGQLVGCAQTSTHTQRAFLYDGSTMKDLGTLGGGSSTAWDINNSGQVVGTSKNSDSIDRAFLYDGASMIDIGTLPGDRRSIGVAINDHGQVAGHGDYHAFLYGGSTMKDLGALSGGQSYTYALNNQGYVVGRSTIDFVGTLHAFLYDGTTMLDLNNLIDPASGWTLTCASGINDSGQIVGWGGISGHTHAYLLNPVPEPSTLALLSMGGCGLLVRVLRRKTKRALCIILLALASATAIQADTFTVTANPLWTNTGISLDPSDSINIHDAVGAWAYGDPWTTGPDGYYLGPSYWYDEWVTDGMHGELIGAVVPANCDLNADVPRALLQNDSSLFKIGAESVTLSGVTGILWLGFNDDYTSSWNQTDNYGSMVVQVDPVPEPSTFALLVAAFLGGAILWRRRR